MPVASRFGVGLVLGAAAFALAGCVPTPGPGAYSSASRYHHQQAERNQAQAQRAQGAADWQAANGNYAAADAAHAAAEDHSRSAGWQRFQANKDSFLSGF